jgi:hypothetical protein
MGKHFITCNLWLNSWNEADPMARTADGTSKQLFTRQNYKIAKYDHLSNLQIRGQKYDKKC